MNTRTKASSLAIALVTLFALLLILAQPISAANPEETIATVSFDAGELELSQVPAFDFGTQAISATTQAYAATNETSPVMVSDLRGTQEGWSLNVSLSPFTLSDNTTETLQGAFITIEAASVSGANGTTGTAPTLAGTLQIDADSTETSILTAAAGAGSGVWKVDWVNTDAKLSVLPGTARAGANTATLTWTLQAAE